jgi:hypothetical protein
MPDVANADKEQLEAILGFNLIVPFEGQFHEELEKNIDDESFFKIVDKDEIEIINDYHDRCPLLSMRKSIMRSREYITRFAFMIISNSIFESVSIVVIIANSISLALQDPSAT